MENHKFHEIMKFYLWFWIQVQDLLGLGFKILITAWGFVYSFYPPKRYQFFLHDHTLSKKMEISLGYFLVYKLYESI
jgi:hypothetical protein